MLNFLLVLISLVVVIKSADYAIIYSARIASSLKIAKHVVGFLVVALISVLPETFISITSALKGVPSFGLGTLFGSNVADLTFVFAIVIFFSPHAVKVERRILNISLFYVLTMLTPILFGLDGHYSRLEGIALIIFGVIFYYRMLRKKIDRTEEAPKKFSVKHLLIFLASMLGLLAGSYFTVKYGVLLAASLNVNPVLIGLLIVGMGTTLPELFFSIRAVKHNHDGLALGDILGTVLTDATIIVGLMSAISPFSFSPRIIYVTGVFMLASVLFIFGFMKSGKILTKKEGLYLLFVYSLFIATELIANPT